MSYVNSHNFNDLLRRAVRVSQECGSNVTGARATVAAFIGMSTSTVEMRLRGDIKGPPRHHRAVEARVWAFLDTIAAKQRAWLARLEAEIETKRVSDVQGDLGGAADSLARAKGALGDYHKARQLRG